MDPLSPAPVVAPAWDSVVLAFSGANSAKNSIPVEFRSLVLSNVTNSERILPVEMELFKFF